MSITMDHKKMTALAKELAKDIKSPEDHAAFSEQLTKITIEAVLNAEMEQKNVYMKSIVSVPVPLLILKVMTFLCSSMAGECASSFRGGRPSDDVRTALKGKAFKWSPNQGAWVRKVTANALAEASRLLSQLQTMDAIY